MDTKLLRQKILDLAIRGKLVPQDPNDEPASALLGRIKAEKERLIKEGKIKRSKKTASTSDSRHYENAPFEIPGTWEWCKLEDIVDYEQPTTYIVESTEYDDSYNTPVLTAGKSFILGRTNETKGIYNDLPCIIFDDFTTESKLVDFPFKVKSSAMKILKVQAEISIKYVALFMSITRLISKSHKRYWISEYSKISIPIPPSAEQKRILCEIEKRFALIEQIEQAKNNIHTTIKQVKKKILDLAIHGKLVPQDPADEPASESLRRVNPSAEITCDNEQNRKLPSNWCLTNLGSIGKWKSGATPSRIVKEYYGGQIPWLKTGDLNDDFITCIPENITQKALDETSVYLNPTGSVLIAMYGATIGKVGILTYPATTNQACCACSEYFVNTMYLFYFLIANRSAFIASGGGGAQSNISKEKIVKIKFPLPPLAEQQRIVDSIKELYDTINQIESSLQA